MDSYFKSENLSVGYDGNILIHDININLKKGSITTLIGPNGAGKSTILKSITKNLPIITGQVFIGKQEIQGWSNKEMAKKVAVVLTDRIRPELMTCAEVVAMGRYPYTNMFGKLTKEDTEAVIDALTLVHALDLAKRDFGTLSDGQRQRIMLARAICQNPEVIILDEPTAYLDIRHKIELLDILRNMAKNKNITVIMSLHEIDLAMKVSDYLLCVKGETIKAFGPPEEILKDNTIEELYELEKGSYNLLFGSIELTKPLGKPEVFVIGGNGKGIPCYRYLQKNGIPFATGILYENDVDYYVAKDLSDNIVVAKPFEPMNAGDLNKARELLEMCNIVIDTGVEYGSMNDINKKLVELAREKDIPIKCWQKGEKI